MVRLTAFGRGNAEEPMFSLPVSGSGVDAPLGHVDATPIGRNYRRIVLCMLLVAGYVYISRRPSSIQLPTFWAEDGTVFFKDAIERGGRALVEPYAGQLLFLQRTVAWAATVLPALIQPAIYAAVSIILAVLSSAIVLSSRWRHPVPLVARFVCLLALLCSPQVDDTFATLVNTHWWLGIGLLALGMLRDPPRRSLRIGELAFTAVAALSGLAALYSIPLLSVRAVRNKSRHSLAIVAVAAACILVQAAFLIGSGRHGNLTAILSHPGVALLIGLKRLLGTAAFGAANLADLWPLQTMDWLIWLTVGVLAVALLAVWLACARNRETRFETAALVAVVIGGWFLAMWALTEPGLSIDMLFWPGAAARYFLVPTAAIYLSLLLYRPIGVLSRVGFAVTCVLLATGILSGYRLSVIEPVDWGPFAACVDDARPQCSIVIPPEWQLDVSPPAR